MSVTSQARTFQLGSWKLEIGNWIFPSVFWSILLVNLIVTSLIAVVHLEPFADLATYYQQGQMLAQGKGFTQPIKNNVHIVATEAPFPASDRFVYPLVVA